MRIAFSARWLDFAGLGFGLKAAACAAVLALGAAPAPALDLMLDVRVAEATRAGDISGAVAIVDASLSGETDPAIVEDLLRRRALIYVEAGRAREAGEAWARLAAETAKRVEDMSPDLIPIWEKAGAEFEKSGEVALAVDAYAKALAIVESAGLDPAVAEHLYTRLDSLAEHAPEGPVADQAIEALEAFADYRQDFADRAAGGLRDTSDPDKGYKEVKIYYATDRARSGSELPSEFYGGQRDSRLELGTAVVSIPLSHRPGAIEAPSIWSFEFREDPQRHVVLARITPNASDAVFAEMREQMATSPAKEAFVFVHGFNVPFNEAAMRTAQMAYDMNFEGLPILYSWPSRGSVLSYIADTAVVNLSGRRLTLFLEDIVAKSGATRIHLIAHSMGNRALTDALELYALRNQGKPAAFDQVLFTAPDLDAGLFGEMVKTIRPTAQRITLYASNRDWALAVSRQLHGDSPRAGQGGNDILRLADVDSIDMTTIGEDMLAHSYYANNPSALTDILSLFWRDAPPEQRCGMSKSTSDKGAYWAYSPEPCDSAALLSTLSILRRGSVKTATEARSFLNSYILSPTIDAGERSRLEQALGRLFGKS
ncbi:MAG: alpha/beta hydrolase [Mesorhizobium sp.]|nr:alpha/beta hydrolase [Mesorhizobium sp.]MCO5160928.1 alpha/beta hydrolase [Mesorhizobium sp.]